MRFLVPIPVALSLVACQATPVEPAAKSGAQASVERLALALVDLAARRVDLSTVRAAVLPFRAEPRAEPVGTTTVATSPDARDLVSAELQGEFELVLANRLHLVEPTWLVDEPSAAATASRESGTLAAASHALLGAYAVRGGELILSVRLVDLESHLVLSAAREALPLSWFSARARAQLEPPPAPRPRSVTAARAVVGAAVEPPGVAPPDAASAGLAVVASAQTERASPAPAPVQPALSPTPSATVEDFETWRARRQQAGNLPSNAAQAPPSPAPQGSPTAEPSASPRAAGSSGAAPAPPPRSLGAAGDFPWRKDGKLGRLLGVPKQSQRTEPRPK